VNQVFKVFYCVNFFPSIIYGLFSALFLCFVSCCNKVDKVMIFADSQITDRDQDLLEGRQDGEGRNL